MQKNSKIFVCGHNGMVGSAILSNLNNNGYKNVITASRSELNLVNQNEVENFFSNLKPEFVFLAAAKVGGIHANDTFSGEFIYENLMIQNNVIHSSYRNNVSKLLFLGSSCIYPKEPKIPIVEESLMTGKLEATNKSYAIAKIAGIEVCQSYKKQYGFNAISIMPTNLYGPNDNYSLENSHVLGAFIRKFHDAKIKGDESVTLWGDGSPYREFLYVKDLAEAAVYCMNVYENEEIINIGTGEDIQIKELSNLVCSIIGYRGNVIWDTTKPNGTPRKLLDISKIKEIGWQPSTSLEQGIKETYNWFLENYDNLRI
jgi:GDP-L-fucose synthase